MGALGHDAMVVLRLVCYAFGCRCGVHGGNDRVDDLDDLAAAMRDSDPLVTLDVRRGDERSSGAICGSIHIPLHDLERRMDEVPTDIPVWVHCASGYRAAIAASLLARAGRTPVLIDDDDRRLAQVGSDLEAA